MYLVATKTIITTAMQRAFDDNAPEPDFANLLVSIEYPVDRQNYPSIWVDFDPEGDLTVAGIGQRELADNEDPLSAVVYRWRFSGQVTFTVAALSSLERDRLYDAVVKVLAFGDTSDDLSRYRSYIESNDRIAMNGNFDQIGQRGFATSQGTPWGTDEVIYEATLAQHLVGEFTMNSAAQIVPLSGVNVYEWLTVPGPDPLPTNDWIG